MDASNYEEYFGPFAYLYRKRVLDRKKAISWGEPIYSAPAKQSLITYVATILSVLLVAAIVFPSFPELHTYRGAITTSKPLENVISEKNGLIKKLSVNAGDIVDVGQIIADISDTQNLEFDASALQSEIRTLRNILADIERKKTAATEIFEIETIAKQRERIDLSAELETIIGRVSILNSVLDARKESLANILELVREGTITKIEELERTTRLLETQDSIAQLKLSEKQIRSSLSSIDQEKRSLEVKYERDITDLEQQSSEIDLRLNKVREVARRSVIAPFNGQVVALNVFENSWVEFGDIILEIMPLDAQYEVEFYIPSSSKALVKEGLDVQIVPDAFLTNDYSPLGGKISSIASTPKTPKYFNSLVPQNEPYYTATVELTVKDVGQYLELLRYGQQADIKVVRRDRSLFEMIFG